MNEILPLREQAAIRDRWLKTRLDTVVPELLERENIDMWIVICREYNEDPVLMSLLPATSMSARRRTILVFARTETAVERLTLSRYGYEGFYDGAWNPDEEDQFECLARIVREHDPERIGINTSRDFAFGDGISQTELQLVREALGESCAARMISAEKLCVGWLERRSAEEIIAYPRLGKSGHKVPRAPFPPRSSTRA
ncbi:MAG: hypothetical protein OXG23_14195 [Chloroflexi bacterium]|nr:hypothetical protein [Chloroflexota bacterium]